MGETVYLIGAGVNQSVEDWHGLRPPLAQDFFRTALQSEKYWGDHYTTRIKPLYEYIEHFWKKSKNELKDENFDLEQLFTLLEMQRADLYRAGDLSRVRELVEVEFRLKAFLAEFLSDFDHFTSTSAAMMALGQLIYRDKPVVITFNYDCMIEEVIESASGVRSEVPKAFLENPDGRDATEEELAYSHFHWNRPLAYGMRFSEVQLQRAGLRTYVSGERFYDHPENKLYEPPILKLHGSLNWFRYLPARKYPQFGEAEPLGAERLRELILVRGHWWFNEPPDRNGWIIDPLLITPVLDKRPFLQQPIFVDLWQRALLELSNARRLVVMGYSFSPTDFSTRRLFLEAFAENALDELIVVNPDTTIADLCKELTHFDKPVAVYRNLEEYVHMAIPDSPYFAIAEWKKRADARVER